jgi:hypothetical protein
MNTLLVRLVGAGIFFLAIFLSGFWLSRSGKPYSSLYLNIHKLIALAAVVFLVMTITRLNQVARLNILELTVCLVAALLFLIAIISGGLVSIPKELPATITTLHHLLPYAVVLATAVTLYFLLHRLS